ncbi:MAG: Toxin-antitoxin system, antitoxin component, Xre family [Candidatus Woesebacteria bacterium GW2011_GWA1_33_30]|uniref:Toxin-antitoxin system, antitoxin component, Xre family n=1 Tax=Candidatus Woesebacteria bacterium GW2011_GWA2_33_28 TaxID=1618561 RepID=A0A0G0C9U9_9BACT|nr:MAG: Toxin-antitoxin system, antitoxin component, Xre family [Candidatus Woesebacteria bacterium GW2011_GWA2_33_28]KKP48773.1 MAG: Toxin-antitoxin system, antitoxin component, Xre family [Candidatus Woesebacteria bacterium GW2011_GWA1_33_30]KKP50046.1 MAG: Toxin-antitoxin system, antitoxin component, Xre family [Microgenomates group bacterium GW2011_GWC1_33_32]KKP51817.1 MAG: Toxin-antitoxin system, antitoxin component, Xre family [Candidatus Woesebacteria bacterium GW2011_GWB1_33_38]KKP5781
MLKGTNFDDILKEELKNPKFNKEWDKLEPAYQAQRILIQSRIKAKMSQRQLAKKAKTTQAIISRIENMTINPSIGLLQKLATAFGKRLEINFS